MNLKFDFSGRNVVVTGGARGIGHEIARRFLEAGARVEIWDVAKGLLDEARHMLAQFSGHLTTQVVNIADFSETREAASALPFPVNILVNNAGITRDKSFRKMEVSDYEAVVQVNLVGMMNVTKSLLELFASGDPAGRIINIASIVGLYGNFGQTNYAAAKAGVIGFTKSLAKELGPRGITVNAIAPGFTMTEMVKTIPADQFAALVARIPVGRAGEPGDQANACLFLAAQEAQYINGAVLSVDGGSI